MVPGIFELDMSGNSPAVRHSAPESNALSYGHAA
jgi:hypothetical protein